MDPYTGDEELDALVQERMTTLDPALKRLFDDAASSLYIESFAASAGLSPEQTDDLKHEIMLMMLGFTPPDDFSFILMTELEMPPRQAFAVEHWVKGVFLKDVMSLIAPESAIEGVVTPPESVPAPLPAPEPAPVPVSSPAVEVAPAVPVQPALVTPAPLVASIPAPAPIVLQPVEQAIPAAPYIVPTPAPAPIPEQPPVYQEPAPVAAPTPVPAPITPPPAPQRPIAIPAAPVAVVPAPQPAASVQPVIAAPQQQTSVTPALPPLPKALTPIPLPMKQIPAVPSIAASTPAINLEKSVARPHTMFEDIARVRGAITPAGVARYDRPLAPTPAYAK